MKYDFKKKNKIIFAPETDLDVFDIAQFVGNQEVPYVLTWANMEDERKLVSVEIELDQLWDWMRSKIKVK